MLQEKDQEFEITDFKNADEFSEITGLYGIDVVEFLLKELKKVKGEG